MSNNGDEERAEKIKRLYAEGWPIFSIARYLKCSDALVSYRVHERYEKVEERCKPGRKKKSYKACWAAENYVPKPPRTKEMKPEQIDELFNGCKFEDEVNAEKYKR